MRYTLRVEFEWDEAKNQANIAKHGLSFEDASAAFEGDDCLEYWDEASSIDEDRYVLIGPIESGIVTVEYTERHGDTIRIISARRATVGEITELRRELGLQS